MSALVFCLGLALGVASPAHADDVLDSARNALTAKNPKRAYDTLAPLAQERAGDPAFDLLLGTAAVETARHTEAVFALERVLAVQPDNVEARAQIARAYFGLKENDAARREFESVKRTNVSKDVVSAVDGYLSALDRADARNKNSLRGFVEAYGGRDSNVNSATADRGVSVPIFGGAVFALAPGGSKLEDNFLGLAGGVNFRIPQTPTWALVGGASIGRRWNQRETGFDPSFTDFSFGGQRRKDKDTITLLGQYNVFEIAQFQNAFRIAAGGSLQWLRDVDLRNQMSAFVQMAQLSYVDQQIRDSNRWVVGAGAAHALRAGFVMFGTAYTGQEVPLNKAFAYVGHTLYGVRGGAEMPLNDDLRAFGNLNYERRNYDGQEPLFLATRHDDQYGGAVGLHYVPARDWRVTPQFFWIYNQSSLALSTFHRSVAEVRIRRDF
jgi:hypothetical protein